MKRIAFYIVIFVFLILLLPFELIAQESGKHSLQKSSLQEELNRLRNFKPDAFRHREMIEKLLPNKNFFDILFLAASYCDNDIQKLQNELPFIYAAFQPRIIQDLDGDSEREIVIDLSTFLSGDTIWFYVLDRQDDTIKTFEFRRDDVPMMNISSETYRKSNRIVLSRRRSRKIPVQDTNKLVTMEYTEKMVLGFTGEAITIISPLHVLDEQIVLDY